MMTRKKIIPEDLIQKTNLQQHNYMIAAINDVDERQKDVEDSNAATNADVATLKNDVVILNDVKYDKVDAAALEQEFAAFPAEVQTMIVNSFDTHLKDVLVDDDMLRFSTDQKAIFLQKNRRDGVTVDEQIPISTRQNVGLATPEDLQAIDGLTSRVTTLENSGITGELFYLNRDFSGMTDAVRTVHFNADIGKPPVTGDSVIDSQQKSWRYVITGPTTFGWVEVPHLSIGGDLKAVKSSNADGKVYVESDNTCSVVGWNGVKNDISGNTSAIGAHAGNTSNPHGVTKAQVGLGSYPASPADIGISTATQTALNGKADKADLPIVATEAEAIAGVDDTKVMTPLKVKLATDDIIDLFLAPVNCTALSAMFKDATTLKVSPPMNASGCTSFTEMFYGCSNLAGVGYILCPNATNMYRMFRGCSSLTTVPLLNTSSVTDMKEMFRDCTSLATIPLLDTSNVTDMESMFANCSSLTLIPLLDTSNVTGMKFMFGGCSSLKTIPLLDTSNVTDMSYMFRTCSSLTTIPMLDISKVTNMSYMFDGCSVLSSVTFQCNDVRPYVANMFAGTPIASGNGYIYVPDSLVQAYKTASGWSAHASVIFGHSDKN